MTNSLNSTHLYYNLRYNMIKHIFLQVIFQQVLPSLTKSILPVTYNTHPTNRTSLPSKKQNQQTYLIPQVV